MSLYTQDEIDDVKARNPLADVAARYVTLRRLGQRFVAACPICGGGAHAARFEVKGDAWVCAVCCDGGDVIKLIQQVERCDFVTAVDRLGGRVQMDQARTDELKRARDKDRANREQTSARYREKERQRLWSMWSAAIAPFETPVEYYLKGRGLQLPVRCNGIRYLAEAPYFHGNDVDDFGRKSPRCLHRGPAMVAAFVRPDGHFGGLHITWLSGDDVPVKLALTDPESGEVLNSKKMRGSKANAHIAVRFLRSPRRLVIGEGIETVLAVYTAYTAAGRDVSDVAFWAAGDLGNMSGRAAETLQHPSLTTSTGRAQRVPGPMPDPDDPGLAIPDSVEDLLLLGDGDSEQVLTQFALERGARRYSRDGRTVRIAFAPHGRDFNDVLQGAQP